MDPTVKLILDHAGFLKLLQNSSNIYVTKDQELNSKNHVLKNSQVRIFQKTAYMWAAYMSGSRNSFVSIIFVLQYQQNRKAKF